MNYLTIFCYFRFTLLGEKVTQVPRPSLSSALKRDKVVLKPSLEKLALLYDALNKDARKQGYAKYAGYSDTVLKVLESSAGGGAGVQLKTLLEKTLSGNELTRDESKVKAREAQRDLSNAASDLSRDMRRLLPLYYLL